MPKLRINNLSVSLDGYMAGPDQSFEAPMGVGSGPITDWYMRTASFLQTHGETGGDTEGIDSQFAEAGFAGTGATIMGRNMFGPVRGAWPDEKWKGWWDENPPFHHPVYVLTNHARASIEMEGGTTFHFVTDGIHSAYEQAMQAAGGLDVGLGGGANTIGQFLNADLVDYMHFAVTPVLLGSGERVFDNVPNPNLRCTRVTTSDRVTHYELER